MSQRIEQAVIGLLCGLAMFLAFLAAMVGTAPPSVRSSAVAGALAVSLMLFPLAVQRPVRGADLIETAGSLPAPEPSPAATAWQLAAGYVVLALSAVSMAIGLSLLVLLALTWGEGRTPELTTGRYWLLGLSFLGGFVAPLFLLRPRWA